MQVCAGGSGHDELATAFRVTLSCRFSGRGRGGSWYTRGCRGCRCSTGRCLCCCSTTTLLALTTRLTLCRCFTRCGCCCRCGRLAGGRVCCACRLEDDGFPALFCSVLVQDKGAEPAPHNPLALVRRNNLPLNVCSLVAVGW